MKLNWGSYIFILILIFLTLCTVFIIFSLRQDIDLVTEEYYEEGADFTSEMEITERSKDYIDSIIISQEEGYLEFNIPCSLSDIKTFDLWFYRPSDKDEDLRTTLEINDAPVLVSTDNLIKGRYILHISWELDSLDFHIEKNIFIK